MRSLKLCFLLLYEIITPLRKALSDSQRIDLLTSSVLFVDKKKIYLRVYVVDEPLITE